MAFPSQPAYLLVAAMLLAQCCVAAPAGEPGPQARDGDNQPPVLVVNIPLQSIPENNLGNKGYHLINLSKYFSDDGGGENLTFSLACVTEPGNISATVDGCFLSFTVSVEDWTGQEKFRVRATDAGGLQTESNDFTVRVTPGPSHLRFYTLPKIDVETQSDWFFDLLDYISDPMYGFEGLHLKTNSSFILVDILRLNINYTVNYEEVPFIDSVLLNATSPSGTAEAVLTVKVWPRGHFWNPFQQPRTIVVTQDINRTLDLSNTIMSNETPLPALAWRVLAPENGSSPILNCYLANNTTLAIAPARRRSGNWTITLTATDGRGRTETCALPVRVEPAFDPGRISMTRNWTVKQGSDESLCLTVDGPNDDLVFWTNGTFLHIAKSGRTYFDFGMPGQEEVGKWRLAFCVSWACNTAVAVRWNMTLEVLDVNDPPDTALIIGPGHRKFVSGYNITFECVARDKDGDRLNCTWYSDGREFARGIWVRYGGLPVGTHEIFANVSDGEYSIRSQVIAVTIVPAPPDENVEGPDYALMIGILAVVCLAAVAMGAALHRSNEKP